VVANAVAVARTRTFALSARVTLAGIVAVSAVLRTLAAQAHVTLYYFPDEYLYPALARGFAHGDGPVVRGEVVHFPALLEPLLTAPFWLFGDPLLALRLTQGFHALAMSLAAVPVYLLARRLRLSTGFALGCALVTVALPDLVYSSFALSDPVAFPLVLGAVYAGVVALERPTTRSQLAFVALAALATFARVQYAALPVAFAVAALALDHRRAFSRYRLTWGLLALPALAVAAVGPHVVLGAYAGVASKGFHVRTLLRWAGSDAMVLVYASGVALIPGALVGLATARGRLERAFSFFTVTFAVGLLAQSGFVATLDSGHVHERYLFPLLPLAAPAFGLALRRGRNAAVAASLLGCGVVVLALSVPLSGFAAGQGWDSSQVLAAELRLEQLLTTGNGSALVALAACALGLLGAAVLWRPRLAVVGLAAAFAASASLSLAATSFDSQIAHGVRANDIPADLQWVDHAGLGRVTLVESPGSIAPHALEALWWNESIERELTLLDEKPTDHFGGSARARIARDGTLVAHGRAVRGPLLVQTVGSQVGFENATLVRRGPGFQLVRPNGPARISILANGLFQDGWLATSGTITVWPDASGVTDGTLHLVVGLPRGARPVPLRFGSQTLVVRGGEKRVVDLRLSGNGPQSVRWSTDQGSFASGYRRVSVVSTAPEFRRTSGGVAVCGSTV
jgi:Dolichyl-phosphate-mannose-protein mannosyltransferase